MTERDLVAQLRVRKLISCKKSPVKQTFPYCIPFIALIMNRAPSTMVAKVKINFTIALLAFRGFCIGFLDKLLLPSAA